MDAFFLDKTLPLARGRITLTEIADGSGVAQSLISNLENGKKPANTDIIAKIANFLKVPFKYLASNDEWCPLTKAISLTEGQKNRDLLWKYAVEHISDVQSTAIYEHSGLCPEIIQLWNRLGYRIGAQTHPIEKVKEVSDRLQGYSFCLDRKVTSLHFSRARFKLDMSIETALEVQRELEEFALFLLFKCERRQEQESEKKEVEISDAQPSLVECEDA